MSSSLNLPLLAAGAGSAMAALLHLGILVGGARWYRNFGAGEQFAQAAQAAQWWPALVTLGIAVVLFVCACYAWGASGGAPALSGLPGLRQVLWAIAAVYLLRGVLPLVGLLLAGGLTPFWVWTSLVSLTLGLLHAWGLLK